MRLRKIPRSFYLQPTLEVARGLLGLFLVRKIRRNRLAGKIVEVEAYLGSKDPASHAYRGMTKRNEVMFWKGGHLYVYFTYGMHYCCNVVTESEGTGHAVLLRAVEPMAGIELMKRNRKRPKQENRMSALCSGPARLCQAFEIGRKENGTDLCGDRIWIAREIRSTRPQKVSRSTRVGISDGKHHKWRYFLKHSPYISTGKPV
jgi:DNA-3-methyladenine glycosylase